MKTLSEHLTVLITIAEEIVRRPAALIPMSLPRGFSETAAEIYRADSAPAVETRCTFAGVIMCKAIEALFSGMVGDDHYLSTIGHTLPRLRAEAWQAMRNEKEVAAESKR